MRYAYLELTCPECGSETARSEEERLSPDYTESLFISCVDCDHSVNGHGNTKVLWYDIYRAYTQQEETDATKD